MRCTEIRQLLPACEREQQPSLAVRRHLAGCPECRAELDHYKELAGALREMRASVVEVPPQLSSVLMQIPVSRGVLAVVRGHASNARTHVARNRVAYVGGAVAVAGALGATLWRTRTRRAVAA